MELVSGGVMETFSGGVKRSYTTTSSSCSCTFVANYQAPCSHMIYIRRLDSMYDSSKHIFNKDVFHLRYHRNDFLINILSNTEREGDASAADQLDNPNNQDNLEEVVDYEEDVDETPVMDDRQKFKMVMPLLLKIANIASVCGTKQFLEYFEDLEIMEKKMRRGYRIYSNAEKFVEEVEPVCDSNNNEDIGEEGGEEGDNEELGVVEGGEDE